MKPLLPGLLERGMEPVSVADDDCGFLAHATQAFPADLHAQNRTPDTIREYKLLFSHLTKFGETHTRTAISQNHPQPPAVGHMGLPGRSLMPEAHRETLVLCVPRERSGRSLLRSQKHGTVDRRRIDPCGIQLQPSVR